MEVKKQLTKFAVKYAKSSAEIESALRLRFEVFNLELNEGLESSYSIGLDRDQYDTYCDHLIITDTLNDAVIGTYRLLLGSRVENTIGYYAENEFHMSLLKKVPGEKLELGRACIHRDYRGTAVLNSMWAGIAEYIIKHEVRYIFGCGSIHTVNPNIISTIYAYLKEKFLADEKYRVFPIKIIPGFNPAAIPDKKVVSNYMPPLLSAYIRLGARIAGEPAFDEQFGVADLLIILENDKIVGRYIRHYFEKENA
jgi:putative hemolysin